MNDRKLLVMNNSLAKKWGKNHLHIYSIRDNIIQRELFAEVKRESGTEGKGLYWKVKSFLVMRKGKSHEKHRHGKKA